MLRMDNNQVHAYILAECNLLLNRLPANNEYNIKDMGIKIVKSNSGDIDIMGLYHTPIDNWSNEVLEKLYVKLFYILSKIYESTS